MISSNKHHQDKHYHIKLDQYKRFDKYKDYRFLDQLLNYLSWTDLKEFKNWARALTQQIKTKPQISQYSWFYDEVINAALEYRSFTREMGRLYQEILQVLNRSPPLLTEVFIYRGVKNNTILNFEDLELGHTLTFERFSSFSLDLEVAQRFSFDGETQGFIFRWKNSAAQANKFIFLDQRLETSKYPEAEILTYPHTQFKVINKIPANSDFPALVEIELIFSKALVLEPRHYDHHFDRFFNQRMRQLSGQISNRQTAWGLANDQTPHLFLTKQMVVYIQKEYRMEPQTLQKKTKKISRLMTRVDHIFVTRFDKNLSNIIRRRIYRDTYLRDLKLYRMPINLERIVENYPLSDKQYPKGKILVRLSYEGTSLDKRITYCQLVRYLNGQQIESIFYDRKYHPITYTYFDWVKPICQPNHTLSSN